MDEVPMIVVIISSLSGILSGLFGIGGGIFIQPALYNLLDLYYPHFENPWLIARTTSFCCVAVIGLTTLIARRKDITKPIWYYLGIFTCVCSGVYLEMLLVSKHDIVEIKKGFMMFLYLLGAYKLIAQQKIKQPSRLFKLCLPLCIILASSVAACLGVGGGSLLFPLYLRLTQCKKEACILGAMSTVMIALSILTLTYLENSNIPYSGEVVAGIYIPALIGILSIGMLMSKVGIWLNKHLSMLFLERILGMVLVVIAAASVQIEWAIIAVIPIVLVKAIQHMQTKHVEETSY